MVGITGIETHRHLGEKRYEIKDHLGNVRAVTSDIKNASNYSAVASSWRFLADVRSLNNYHPYGSLIDEGSWSGNDYNFGYNGMLKEGIGKDISHTHFRNLSSGDYLCCSYIKEKILTESTLYSCWSKSEEYDNLFILGLLHSSILNYYIKHKMITNEQAFPQILMTDLGELPFPKITQEQQQPIIDIVEKILEAKKANPAADTSH